MKRLFLTLFVLAACECDPERLPNRDAGARDDGSVTTDTNTLDVPPLDVPTLALNLSSVEPDHGPFIGGNRVVIRGVGFGDAPDVSFGGNLVQPADITVLDTTRLNVVVPAGVPGPVDVEVTQGIDDDAQSASLPNGYEYDNAYVEPNSGAIAGGIRIVITATGTAFVEGATVRVGVNDCTNVVVVSETRVECTLPPGIVGPADVSVLSDGVETKIDEGFTYFDSADPLGGGLGGGPSDGTINITVVDSFLGMPIPDALTYLGPDASGTYNGLTNALGQITFSGSDITGEQTVTVAKTCFEATTIKTFDARDVTVFLTPWLDPACGDPGGGGGIPGRGRFGSFISGNLIFRGPAENGPNPWGNIPPALPGEERVAYVYTTQACRGTAPGCRNPAPDSGGAHRVREADITPNGYPYRIFARPAALAVYALVGVENLQSGKFTPYAIGVTRNLVTAPAEEISADIVVDIPLDSFLEIQMSNLPPRVGGSPNQFIVNASLDLGGEGFIERIINDSPFDRVTAISASAPFRLPAQPALQGTLSDARFEFDATWGTRTIGGGGDDEISVNFPLTFARRKGIRNVDQTIVVDDYPGLPVVDSPADGQALGPDRRLSWTVSGADPNFFVIIVETSDGNPAWRHFVKGTERSVVMPDLSSIPEVSGLASGFFSWGVFSVRINNYDFNQFSYRDLNQDRWDAYSLNAFRGRIE